MYNLVQILVPLGICVALPVLIVWIIFRSSMNSDNQRAAVLIEAIKANNDIDTAELAKALRKPRKSKSARDILNRRLLNGMIWGSIGLVLTICSTVFYSLEMMDSDDFMVLLIIGLILLGIGLSFIVVYFVTKKQVKLTADNADSEDKR